MDLPRFQIFTIEHVGKRVPLPADLRKIKTPGFYNFEGLLTVEVLERGFYWPIRQVPARGRSRCPPR